jgi:hypothetical protein
MGFLVILPLAAVSGWSVFAIHRWLRSGGYGAQWWKAFKILASIGVCVGVVFAFFLHYQLANARMDGFPIPVKFSNREKPGADWVDANLPRSVSVGATITDLMFGVALCLAPIAIAAFFKENRGKLTNEIRPDGVRQP